MFLTNYDRSTTNYDKSALINKKTVSNITYSALLNLPENVSAVVVNDS